VKFEVTDGKACAVFVIFDSEMSYIMEKSCAYFVAQSKVFFCNSGFSLELLLFFSILVLV
jgi:hypothetical protein